MPRSPAWTGFPHASNGSAAVTAASACSGAAGQKWTLPATTAPWAPAAITATAGPASATVAWTPQSPGGTPLTGYTITTTPATQPVTAGPYATTATVAGLTPGTAYTVTVTASTASGAAATTTTAVTPGNQATYAYDNAGNLTTTVTDGVTATSSYNAAEQLTATTSGGTTISYAYDADGNQVTAGATGYAYNAAGQLTSAATPAGNFTYAYDNAGNLYTTSRYGTTIQSTRWDSNNPFSLAAEDKGPSGVTTADYAYGPAGLAAMTTPGGSYSPAGDWLGSVTGLVNSSGSQLTSTTYGPWGAPSTTSLASGAPASSIGYAGSYALAGAGGLDDMRARNYNPSTGSFTSVDPMLGETDQPYSYTADSPTARTDPGGAEIPADGGFGSLTIEQILQNPSVLEGMNPDNLLASLGGLPTGFKTAPGQGQSVAPGWKMSDEAHPNIQIRWSAGSRRADHPDSPYWRVSGGQGGSGRSERIPGGDWPDGPAQYTQKGGGDEGACTVAYSGFSSCGGDPLFGDDEGDEDPFFFGDEFPGLLAYQGGCAGQGMII